MRFEFDGEIFRWSARQEDWYFVELPAEASADIRELPRPPRGFGAVRVQAGIGGSRWRTSVFPDAERGRYVLPLKRSVREAEAIDLAAPVHVRLEVQGG